MKYHTTKDNKTSLCGLVQQRPDVFIYSIERFQSHYAKEYECKKCLKILTHINK
jgi:hypothetical protein